MHHSVAMMSFIHRVGTRIRLRDAITAVPSLHLELSGWDVRKRYASSELLNDQTRPGRECLCIVRPYWHHSAALLSFFHQAGTLIRLRDAITAAPSLHIEPSRQGRLRSRHTRQSFFTIKRDRGRGCLSIVRPSWHHPVAIISFIHRVGTLIRLCDTISAAPSLHLRSSPLNVAQARHAEPSSRSSAAGEGMFEQCDAVLAPLSGNSVFIRQVATLIRLCDAIVQPLLSSKRKPPVLSLHLSSACWTSMEHPWSKRRDTRPTELLLLHDQTRPDGGCLSGYTHLIL